MSLAALVLRDIRLAARMGGNAFLGLAFFGAMLTLAPLGIGAQIPLLAAIAAGLLWVAAVLATLLSLDRLFQADYEDGTLDLLAMGPLSLETIAVAKIVAHWLTTGLPLTILSPLAALLFNLPARGIGALVETLAIGTPAISAVGAVGASLTLAIRRGGLILPLIVLPLIAPAVIFGAGEVRAALDRIDSGALLFLGAFSLFTLLLSPFAIGAGLRLNLHA